MRNCAHWLAARADGEACRSALSRWHDVRQAIEYFAREAGTDVALAFVGTLEATYRLIGEHPKTGSARYLHELRLPGLRHRRLRRYRWLVFYIEHETYIDVWRVLDGRRDIPAWLDEPDDQ